MSNRPLPGPASTPEPLSSSQPGVPDAGRPLPATAFVLASTFEEAVPSMWPSMRPSMGPFLAFPRVAVPPPIGSTGRTAVSPFSRNRSLSQVLDDAFRRFYANPLEEWLGGLIGRFRR